MLSMKQCSCSCKNLTWYLSKINFEFMNYIYDIKYHHVLLNLKQNIVFKGFIRCIAIGFTGLHKPRLMTSEVET